MRAAIYARFSTDLQTESSIADQARVACKYAQERGWEITARFDDQGISGAAIGNRPGIQAVIAAGLAREIDALIVTDLSRLSRSQADLPKIIERLNACGVCVIGVQDGYDSTRKGHKLQAGFSGIMGEAFREMIKDRVTSSMRMRAEQGYHTGGSAFGYRIVPADGKYFRKQIYPDHAAIVREIFQRYAEGETMRAIAEDLNARKVPSAGSHWKRETRRKDGKWLVSALHALLHNELYIGQLIYGRRVSHKDPDSGARVFKETPASEWIVRDMPEIAIIDRPMWDRVQARLGVNVGSGKTRAKPAYLLSGLLVCGKCGSKMIVMGGKDRRYICGSYHGGGISACGNTLTVARLLAEELIVEPQFKRLSAKVVDKTVASVKSQTRAGQRGPVRRTSPDLAKTNARIADLDRMVASGTLSLAEAGPALERARAARVAAELSANAAPVIDFAEMAEEFRGLTGRLRRALGGADVSQAREALRQMVGPIQLKPFTERYEARALKAEETLDGKGSAGGTFEETYLVAHFDRAPGTLPLHPFLTAEWFKATGISSGSGGASDIDIPPIPLRRRIA